MLATIASQTPSKRIIKCFSSLMCFPSIPTYLGEETSWRNGNITNSDTTDLGWIQFYHLLHVWLWTRHLTSLSLNKMGWILEATLEPGLRTDKLMKEPVNKSFWNRIERASDTSSPRLILEDRFLSRKHIRAPRLRPGADSCSVLLCLGHVNFQVEKSNNQLDSETESLVSIQINHEDSNQGYNHK